MTSDGGQGDAVPLITRARHREHLEQAFLHLETFLSYGMCYLDLGAETLIVNRY